MPIDSDVSAGYGGYGGGGYSGNPRGENSGFSGGGWNSVTEGHDERRAKNRRGLRGFMDRDGQASGMFAPFGGAFPFLNNIPSGQLAQSWMPPIMPFGGPPPQNLQELYSAYGAGPSGVMPGFLPPARPTPPAAPQAGGQAPTSEFWQRLAQRIPGLSGIPFGATAPGMVNPGTITPL